MRVEHARHLHEAVITLKTSAPDHRRKVVLARVKGQDRQVWQAWRDGLGWIVNGRRSIKAVAVNVIVDVPPCLGGRLVAEPDILADVVRKRKPAVRHACEAAEQHNTLRAQRLQAYRVKRTEQRPPRNTTVWTDEVLARNII